MWLDCPALASAARPGQFVMVDCGAECLLLRPFSIHRVNEDGQIALFFVVLEDGKGTQWLSRRKAGDSVRLLGTLGNGFTINIDANNLLLVAGGNGIAPLYFLADDALKRGYSVRILYGTADTKRCPLPPEVELVSATEDGSAGYKGRITDLIPEHIGWADQVFACGPLPMYRAMAAKRRKLLKDKPTQISLEMRLGCGVGVCYGCTIKTKVGLKQVCQDGPVFDLDAVVWGEFGC